jgi:phenylacetate-CoA ligase
MAQPVTIRTRDKLLQWPRVPVPGEAPVLILVNQFQQTQKLSADDLRVRQFAQMGALLSHCLSTVPWYQENLPPDLMPEGSVLTPEIWANVPVLDRAQVLAHGSQLESTAPPESHGNIRTVQSSGTTGRPVTIKAANVSNLHYHATMARNGIWQGYDPAFQAASIVRLNETQLKQADAGTYPNWMTGCVSGPSKFFDVAVPAEAQLQWLADSGTQLLTTYPSNLQQLAYVAERDGTALPDLNAIMTMGEPLTESTRTHVRDVFGLPIHDVYTAQETGILALQCPEHDHYHIMAEGNYVEVLNDAGEACRPGEIGRVVATPMHNFVMPLLRYALGDYAEVGEPCDCGRGLPTLKRIMGQAQGQMMMPNGHRVWMSIGTRGLRDYAPIIRNQIIQKTLNTFEARMVRERELQEDEEAALHEHLLGRLTMPGHQDPIELSMEFVDTLVNNTAGKFENFICQVDQPS